MKKHFVEAETLHRVALYLISSDSEETLPRSCFTYFAQLRFRYQNVSFLIRMGEEGKNQERRKSFPVNSVNQTQIIFSHPHLPNNNNA
jgi:hypothetical protein